jgi:hypothetical protein
MNRTQVLILCDAGSAGRDLLVRRDLDLFWALTVPEALAVVSQARPRVALVREEMAFEYLTETLERESRPPAVILLEEGGLTWREAYFAAGASAMIGASNRVGTLQLFSELTGLAFGLHPRVPYREMIDVCLAGRTSSVECLEFSVSGVALRDLGAQPGERLDVTFVTAEGPLTLSARCMRVEEDAAGSIAGVAFDNLTDEQHAALQRLVAATQEELRPLPEPVGLTQGLEACVSLEELAAGEPRSARDDELATLRALLLSGAGGDAGAPGWLRRLARELTPLERAAAMGRMAPPFATAALEARLEVARDRAQSGVTVPSASKRDRMIELCRTLAREAEGAPAPYLVQVAEIRAGLMRSVYGYVAGPRFAGEGAALRAAAPEAPPDAAPRATRDLPARLA